MKSERMMLFFLLFLFFPGSALADESALADDMNTKTEEVVYYNNGIDIRGFLAAPGDNGKHPGMILIHEWWGLNDNIRKNAIAFAKLGYVTLAVDLYGGQSATDPQRAMTLAGRVRTNYVCLFSPRG